MGQCSEHEISPMPWQWNWSALCLAAALKFETCCLLLLSVLFYTGLMLSELFGTCLMVCPFLFHTQIFFFKTHTTCRNPKHQHSLSCFRTFCRITFMMAVRGGGKVVLFRICVHSIHSIHVTIILTDVSV
jgi:hypothetical protein